MKVIRSIPGNCGKNGEDYLSYSNNNYLLVLDGASGLHKDIIKKEGTYTNETDAQWFVRRFAELIRNNMDTVVPAKEIVKRCIIEIKNDYERLRIDSSCDTSIYEPSASMALIKRTCEKIELLVLGDITVILKKSDGETSVIFDDSVQKLDDLALTAATKIFDEKHIDIIDAVLQESVRNILRKNRDLRNSNSETGYWILGLQPEAIDHAKHLEIDEGKMDKTLVCTDGFASYCNKYHLAADAVSLMNIAEKQPLKRMLRKIRSIEGNDPKCNTFPRLKPSDDATAALMIGNAERKENRKQNLWKRFNILFFRIIGKWQSAFMAFGIKKSYIATILLTAATLVHTFITIFLIDPSDAGNTGANQVNPNIVPLDIISKLPLIITVITALATLASTVYEYRNFSRAYMIFSNENIKQKTLQQLRLSPEQVGNGYQVLDFFNGRSNERYVMSNGVNKHLQDTSKEAYIQVHLLNYRFRIADEVSRLVPSIMNLTFTKPGITFNGHLLRQISDLHPGISSVAVQKTAYFDGQCTHEIVFKKFKSSHEIKLSFDGSKLLIDEDNQLYDLDYSSCSNFIGVSTLAFTKDNRIIIGKQADRSKANSGRYAPSGSGSVNYKDVKCKGGTKDKKNQNGFKNILINAMMREFCEECNYKLKTARAKMRTRIIGYVRLLERGGKPDYFGISYIDDSIFDISSEIRKREYGLSSRYVFTSFSDVEEIPVVLRRFCDEHVGEKKISIQLDIICGLLEQMAKENQLTRFINELKNSNV